MEFNRTTGDSINLEIEDIIIQYIHINSEPMEPEEFWIKTYYGKSKYNQYFTRHEYTLKY